MSKVAIEGNASGSGTFTITSPNSNTNRTLTLPDSTGTVVVSGTTPSLNGIAFPATQSASADANTLDDYEEGTWTPVVVGTSSAGTVSYSQQVGRYTKIGNRVFFQFTVVYSGGTGTGNLRVTGLPFTNVSGTGLSSTPSMAIQNITLTAGHYVVGDVPQGNTRVDIYSQPTGGGGTLDVAYDAVGDIYCSGHYPIS